jgi:SAM-dependent methyltransferase
MSPQTQLDPAKQEAFAGRVISDVSATMSTLLATMGDRLGLFKDLAKNGPCTSAELASRTQIQERYAREWLGGMASAGYLEYEPTSGSFRLPVEHAAALADEAGPFFCGGFYGMLPAMVGILDPLMKAFREGGGVPQSSYDTGFWDGLERFTGVWFENLLLQQWVPAMPNVEEKLTHGAVVADVGCGRGRALIKLAQAFPNSRFVGYDVFPPAVEEAGVRAKAAGLGDRATFQHLDASEGIPQKFDIITTFDVVHDAVDPLGLLKQIKAALNSDGIYVCLDVNCSGKLEENAGPFGSMFHGVSVLYCMTTSLANGGAGLGTLGFHEGKVRELCADAGFSDVRRVPIENPFNSLYEIRR